MMNGYNFVQGKRGSKSSTFNFHIDNIDQIFPFMYSIMFYRANET